MREYICECGKVFTEPNRFNGHKSNCKVHHQAKGTLNLLKEKYEKNRKGGLKSGQKSAERKLKRFEKWLSEKHTCEKCGKVMTERYASGRFCSRSCANGHIRSEESKQRTSDSLRSRFTYVQYEGKELTNEALIKYLDTKEKTLQQECIRRLKRKNIAKSIDMKNSPYADFDQVFINESAEIGIYYYFTKHDEKGSIIKRVLCPVYRYIIEKELGRRLNKNEVVHHIDFDHFNNDRKNLIVMSRSEHIKLHNTRQ